MEENVKGISNDEHELGSTFIIFWCIMIMGVLGIICCCLF
jgi:hypothetical protein